jgi:hypothetical protein
VTLAGAEADFYDRFAERISQNSGAPASPTWLRSNNIDPGTVMEYAGHADLETTLRCLRPTAGSERMAAVSEIKWY